MIKEIIEANEQVQPNDKEIQVLRETFPACFHADGSFDLVRFKEYLNDKLDISGEGYELKFLGKNYARLLASLDTTTVIQPDAEHNAKVENKNSENIYISGDNLDALKHLLGSYNGQVKCIYIDPPYNTGSDGFVYNDKFNYTKEELADKLSINYDEAQRILELSKRGSASHSAWLMFMYPRLQLARDLLSDDGVIFISIDDNEQANLKLICDDVFGEENFEGHIHWRRRSNQPNDKTKLIGLVAEHILVYSRNKQVLKEVGVGKIALTGTFSNPDSDPRGDWASKPWKVGSGQSGTSYIIISPNGAEFDEEWMGDSETYNSLLADNRIVFPRNGDGLPRKKYFKAERQAEGQCASNWWTHEIYGNNQEASEELTALFGFKNAFSNPKPTKLLDTIIGLANIKNGDIVVDFFSGSATTAVAANKYAIDCRCKYILVQLPEDLDIEYVNASQSDKGRLKEILNMLDSVNRPHTLDQIGMERIIRAARKIKEEHPDTTADLGFKHYTLVEPSKDTLDTLLEFDPRDAGAFADNTVLNQFGLPTVLTTWLLHDGEGLTDNYSVLDFAGYKAYYADKYLYLVEPNLTRDAIDAIIAKCESEGGFNPENIVLFGYSFGWTEIEELKVNLKRLKDTEKNLQINFSVRY